MKSKSIKTKLVVIFSLLILIICIGLVGITYTVSSKMLKDNINQSLLSLSKESSKTVKETINNKLNSLQVLADKNTISGIDTTLEEKMEFLKSESKKGGHLWLTIADAEGNAITSNGDTVNVADLDYYKSAKSGNSVISNPHISAFSERSVIIYAVPIKRSKSIKGVLISVRDGNELSYMINSIKLGNEGRAFIVNKEGTMIAHKDSTYVKNMFNVFNEVKNDSNLSSLANLEEKMIAGEEGVGSYQFDGKEKYMGYSPIPGTSWSLAITAPQSEVMKDVNYLVKVTYIASAIAVFFSLVLTYFVASKITKPLQSLTRFVAVIASGDFTTKISGKLLKKKDETGTLAKSIDTMQESIKGILKEVVSQSSVVSDGLVNITDHMGQLNRSIEDISGTTQELSAGTEEVASSVEEMNTASAEIEKSVETIAVDAQNGTVLVNSVSKMAEEMKQNAIQSKENATQLYQKTRKNLKDAIEQSNSVNQINDMAAGILEITAKTNLLALNAAIEAARAGEAGKGFTVVAGEIKLLADNSKALATKIQEVSLVILEAVNSLSSSSGEILDFIDQEVLKDYDTLVNSSEQYSKNSLNINKIMEKFSVTSQELLTAIHYVTSSIDEVASSTDEAAKGSTNIAQDASTIMNMSYDIIKLSESSKEKSSELIETVSQFKI